MTHTFTQTTLAFITILTLSLGAEEIPQQADQVTPIQTGVAAPNPSLRLPDGKETDLNTIRGDAPTVLIFYRGGWCPYCRKHLQGLMDIEDTLTKAGWKLVALSPDSPDKLKTASKENTFSYQLVSDQDMEAAKAFGLAFRVSDGLVKKYQGYGIDLEKASGRDHQLLPVPAVILINKDGTVSYVYTNPDYKKRLSNKDLLKAAGLSKP